MFSKTITVNGEERKLYFDMSKRDLAKLVHDGLNDQIDSLNQALTWNNEHPDDQKEIDVYEVMDLMAAMIKVAYRVKKRDAAGIDHLVRDPEAADMFVNSTECDDFIWNLFQSPEETNAFMMSMVPAGLLQQAQQEANADMPTALANLTPEQREILAKYSNDQAK